jgi:ribosomal protein L34E
MSRKIRCLNCDYVGEPVLVPEDRHAHRGDEAYGRKEQGCPRCGEWGQWVEDVPDEDAPDETAAELEARVRRETVEAVERAVCGRCIYREYGGYVCQVCAHRAAIRSVLEQGGAR